MRRTLLVVLLLLAVVTLLRVGARPSGEPPADVVTGQLPVGR
jgi:hypothetical protein